MHVARCLAGDFRQLATLAADDPTNHKHQRIQVPRHGPVVGRALRLSGIQLLYGLLYGTILTMAVTHV